MKFYASFLILCFFALTGHSQIDSKNKSTSIPAVKSKKDSANVKPLLPSKPIKSNTLNGMSVPKTNTTLNFPKKEFSMFGEKFGNPGELYEKRLKKLEKEIIKEEGLGTKGSKVDVFFGDYRTKSEYIYIYYRDYGEIDGDIIRVLINDEIIELRVILTGAFKGFKYYLKEGNNKIDFLALDEGYTLPNTAHFRVLDDQKHLIATDLWALKIDIKGTINIIKE